MLKVYNSGFLRSWLHPVTNCVTQIHVRIHDSSWIYRRRAGQIHNQASVVFVLLLITFSWYFILMWKKILGKAGECQIPSVTAIIPDDRRCF